LPLCCGHKESQEIGVLSGFKYHEFWQHPVVMK